MMNEVDKQVAHGIAYKYLDDTDSSRRLQSDITAALTTARKEAREAAFREAAKDVCVHCGQRATSHIAEVEGPNSASNYVHKSKSVRADALCEATSIHARMRFEAVDGR